eukprot:scaffold74411_cov22-Tisochrysis_lutea.AAC.1
MKLMLKLRKELNVTSDEHKEWLQELIKARNEGTLGQFWSKRAGGTATQSENVPLVDMNPVLVNAINQHVPPFHGFPLLSCRLQSGLEQANPAPVAAAGNGWAVSQPYQHQQQAYAQSGMASSEDLSEVDEGGSDSSYSREFLHLQRRQGGAGTSYG